jgi:hypothetical protein
MGLLAGTVVVLFSAADNSHGTEIFLIFNPRAKDSKAISQKITKVSAHQRSHPRASCAAVAAQVRFRVRFFQVTVAKMIPTACFSFVLFSVRKQY